MPSFLTGMDHMAAAIEAGKQRASSGGAPAGGVGSTLNYFSWKNGDKKVIRFLADDMITGEFYDFILNKDGKTSNFMVDRDDPDRLKRYMSATPGIGWKQPYKSTKLEEPKTVKRGVCVAVLRQEVRDPETGKLKVEDYLFDREVDGQMIPSRWFGIVQQGINNFWKQIGAIYRREGSIAVVDLEVTREGDGLDTDYSIIPLPADPVLNNKEIVRDFYFYGQEWNPEDPERFLKCPQTTHQWAEKFSSEERHKRLLVPDGTTSVTPPATQSGLGEFAAGTTSNPEADEAQAMRSSGTQFSSLADTLLNKARNGK